MAECTRVPSLVFEVWIRLPSNSIMTSENLSHQFLAILMGICLTEELKDLGECLGLILSLQVVDNVGDLRESFRTVSSLRRLRVNDGSWSSCSGNSELSLTLALLLTLRCIGCVGRRWGWSRLCLGWRKVSRALAGEARGSGGNIALELLLLFSR